MPVTASIVTLEPTVPILMPAVFEPVTAVIATAPPISLVWTKPRPSTAPVTFRRLSTSASIVTLPLTMLGSIMRVLFPVTAVIAMAPSTVESVMWAWLSTAAVIVMALTGRLIAPTVVMSSVMVLLPKVLVPPWYASITMLPPMSLVVTAPPELR